MTWEQHRRRHVALAASLEELVHDWLAQTPHLPQFSAVSDLIAWTNQQAVNPTENQFQSADEAHLPTVEVDRG